MTLLKNTFTGIGQIFLQENRYSGILICIAMFFSHWTLGVGCFLGAFIGTLMAQILKYNQQHIEQGLYGFNASLAFMCAMFTFGLTDACNPLIWLIGLVAALFSTWLMHQFLTRGKVAFTFPFVLSCWICCWAVAEFHLFGLNQTTPALLDNTSLYMSLNEPFYAWAEINFGASAITGVLLFLAIAISSPNAAMWGTAVTPISAIFALHLFNVDQNSIANGIYGFSAILVACAFAGQKFRDFVYVIVGVFLAVVIQYLISLTGLATYTIGFIVASWIILGVKNIVQPNTN